MISNTQHLLLGLLGAKLFSRKQPDVRNEDALPVIKEAVQQAVFLLVYPDLKDKLPERHRSKYRALYLSELASGIRNVSGHDELHRRMAKHRIPYVVIKGLASASFYPQPALRMSGDVDFLVRKKDIEKTKEILIAERYTLGGNVKHPAHYAFYRDKETLEMHWQPNGVPETAAGDLCRRYMSDVLTTSQYYRKENVTCRVPDTFHHGLILLIHTATHLIDTGIGLRHFCDWAVFAATLSDEEFRGIFEEKLKKVGLWHFAQILTALSTKYLGCPEKRWAAEAVDEKLLAAVMEDIFAAGNFGVKDKERINEAKLMTTKGSGTVDGSNLALQLLRALTEKAKIDLPICRKMIILLPVGWIYVIFHHIYLIIQGRKPEIHIGKMVRGAGKRREVYKEFRLYK